MALYRLTISHAIATNAERADNGYWFTDPRSLDDVPGLVTRCATAIDAYWTAIRANCNGTVKPRDARLDVVLENTGTVVRGFQVPVPLSSGSASGNGLPPECSVVCTLRSSLSGARNRGRVFLPPFATSTVDANGTLSTAAQTTVLNGVQALLEGIGDAATSTVPVIYSRTSRQTVAVSQIDVGTVVDVQRRRRQDLVEARVARTITP